MQRQWHCRGSRKLYQSPSSSSSPWSFRMFFWCNADYWIASERNLQRPKAFLLPMERIRVFLLPLAHKNGDNCECVSVTFFANDVIVNFVGSAGAIVPTLTVSSQYHGQSDSYDWEQFTVRDGKYFLPGTRVPVYCQVSRFGLQPNNELLILFTVMLF